MYDEKKPTPPVSTGNNREGKGNSEYGTISAPRSGEDYYDLDHYCRTVSGQDFNYCTQKSGGDSMGHRGEEVGTSFTLTSVQIDGKPKPKISWVKLGGGHLPDQS